MPVAVTSIHRMSMHMKLTPIFHVSINFINIFVLTLSSRSLKIVLNSTAQLLTNYWIKNALNFTKTIGILNINFFQWNGAFTEG